ncbi:hypothetical protein O181_009968 [Austropuccinia psidii MF-1]|uniref:Integrase catalytic domain-containing protein n=1 Tax=Austropuccinia psidii MF-1 TaxID=1389203 RepID=A0A9Q3BS25_9BASI|nr:hypothetical protein [Austropuccinia psidii MF-1]
MDSSKVRQILNWPQPKNIKDLQSFLGFANLYHFFIKYYSKKITDLTSLLKKDSLFIFKDRALSQFQIIKEAFTTDPILSHFNPSLPNIVETDASDYALGAVMSQKDGIKESRFLSIKVEIFSDLVDQIQREVWQDKDYKEILKQLARGESVSEYSLEPQAKLLLFKDRVVVPRNEEIQLNILQKHHESTLAGHPAQEKTLKLIKRDFHWAGINQFIKHYVSSCQKCSRNKKIHHKKFGLLKPLQIPSGPWNSLLMDFITQFPLSNNFDSISVVVDRFSKMAIFIPTYGTVTSLDLAQIFINHVFSKHHLPASITEMVNQILEQYLWVYVSHHQDDLHTWLPLAEFAYNNAENSSTQKSPFFIIYGINPKFDAIHISQDSPSGKVSTKLQSVQQAVKEELESVIRRFKKYADRNRTIPPHFQPGDKIGSYAHHLKFSQQWNSVHPVFHVSLLEPVEKSAIPKQNQLPPPPVIVEEKEEWEVAQVLDSNLKRGKLWYLVE